MNIKDVGLLRRSELFRFLPDDDFEKLQPLLREERYDFGDLIVKQGEPANAFYVLIFGRARAVKTGALVRARSFLYFRFRPAKLAAVVDDFLDDYNL